MASRRVALRYVMLFDTIMITLVVLRYFSLSCVLSSREVSHVFLTTGFIFRRALGIHEKYLAKIQRKINEPQNVAA